MAYYHDLSFFRYSDLPWLFKEGYPYILLNVGWLDSAKDYPKGELADKTRVLYALFRLCRHPVDLHRGFHACGFCQPPSANILRHNQAGVEFTTGNGSILVKGPNNLLYVAPTMIYHYVQDHNYLPPEEFIEALFSIQGNHGDWDYFQRLEQGAVKVGLPADDSP